jgi:large subunit ribosomal protein L19
MNEEVMQAIKPGAKVKVWERIKEGDKERLSAFAGIVIARRHGSEKGATFTLRGKLGEYGLEKTYPIHSPLISKVEIVSSPRKVSRSKLYYVRDIPAKRIKEKLGVKM